MNKGSAVNPRVVSAIEHEKKVLSQYRVGDIVALIESGQVERAVGHAFHFSSVRLAQEVSLQVKSSMEAYLLANKNDDSLLPYASYSVCMSVGLSSALIKWNVQKVFSSQEIEALQNFYTALVGTIPASS